MSDSSQRLVEAVESLWPGAQFTTRRAGVAGGERSWLVLPSLSQPIVLVPPSCRAASVALQPRGTGRGEVVMRGLAWLQRSGLLRFLPVPRLVVEQEPAPGVRTAEAVLAEVLGPVAAVVVRLGRRRFNRALVLMPFDRDGRLLAVVKVARGEAAREVLRREHETLGRVSRMELDGLTVPRPLGHLETDTVSYLVMTPLTSAEANRPEPVPVTQMKALARQGPGEAAALRDTAAVARLRRQASALEDPDQRGWTTAALDDLLAELGEVAVPQGAWHGDWVPWNLARAGSQVLLWDWEHFDPEALLGWDHLHYLAQHLRSSRGTSPAVEDTWVAQADRVLSEEWGLDERQRSAVLRAYLLQINLRYLHDRQEDPLGTPSRAGWARGLVERLAR